MKMQTFVVYEKLTTITVECFDTASSAKRSCTCKNKKYGGDIYGWAEYKTFRSTILNRLLVDSLIRDIKSREV